MDWSLEHPRRFNSHRRAAQRLTLHCGTGVLGYHREAFTAGALESDCVGLGRARQMSLEGKSQTLPRLGLVGDVVTARNAVPAFILPLLHPKRGLRLPCLVMSN